METLVGSHFLRRASASPVATWRAMASDVYGPWRVLPCSINQLPLTGITEQTVQTAQDILSPNLCAGLRHYLGKTISFSD